MSGPANRRGFLRDLAGLPLLGGGLVLIGAPSAVAVPITRDLMSNYETWLSIEAIRVAEELRPGMKLGRVTTLYTPACDWHERHSRGAPPSSRAALILSAVGCGWEARSWL